MGSAIVPKQIKESGFARLKNLRISSETLFVSACVLSAFLLRLLMIPHETVINFDGVYYAQLGKKIISGDLTGGISAYWSPLYSFLIGISSLFFSDLAFAGKFVSIVAGAALVIPVFLLIRDIYGRSAAYLGAVLIVIHPILIRYSLWVMTESVYTFIFICTLLVGWRALRSGKKSLFFGTGLLLGIAYLTRPEAIAFLALFLFLTIGAKLFRKTFKLRNLLANYALLLIAFSIFFLPYVAFIHQKTGILTISQKIEINTPGLGSKSFDQLRLDKDRQLTLRDQLYGDVYNTDGPKPDFSGAFSPQPSRESSSRNFSHKNTSFMGLALHFLSSFKLSVTQHLRDIFPFVYPFVLIIFVGLFYRPWSKLRLAKEVYLSSFFLFTLSIYAATVLETRYLIPIAPIMVCWIAFGIIQFSNWASQSASLVLKKSLRLNPALISVLTMLVLSVPLLVMIPRSISADVLAFEEKEAGLWLKDHSKVPSLVMSPSPIITFYADTNHLYVPNENFLDILEYARRKKVDYLVFDNSRLNLTPNAFPPDEQDLLPGLTLVYANKTVPDSAVLIYQLTY